MFATLRRMCGGGALALAVSPFSTSVCSPESRASPGGGWRGGQEVEQLHRHNKANGNMKDFMIISGSASRELARSLADQFAVDPASVDIQRYVHLKVCDARKYSQIYIDFLMEKCIANCLNL
jgi:hypothetical protein